MIEPGQERMVEALIYVAKKGAGEPFLGKTKIYKALVIADVLAMASLGETITRWKYIRFKNGPVPLKADHYLRTTEDVKVISVPLRGRNNPLHRLVPHREPDTSDFSPEELNILDLALGLACQGNADDVSDLSHGLPAWRWTEDGKVIDNDLLGYPYLVNPRPTSQAEMAFARESLREQGLA